MKKRNIIVTDVDFVLLDWAYGLKPFLKDKDLPFDHLEKFKGSTYYPNLSELFFNDNESQNIELMNEFNKSEFVQHLPIFQNDSVKHLWHIFLLALLSFSSKFLHNKLRIHIPKPSCQS